MLLFFALVLLPLSNFSLGQDFTHIEDIQVLSELPIERLLSIKKGFSIESFEQENNGTDDVMEGRGIPHALALQGKIKLKDRGGYSGGHYQSDDYYHEGNSLKGNKSYKIQSIFQITITSLAFLAFGGYLLCLLIHAIRTKQNYNINNNTQVTQALATYLATKIRRIKNQNRLRKRRKNLKLQGKPNVVKVQRPRLQKKPNNNSYTYTSGQTLSSSSNYNYNYNAGKRQPRPKRDIIGSVGGYIVYDDMYFTLLNLSEAYTKYHTIDILSYNKTKGFF